MDIDFDVTSISFGEEEPFPCPFCKYYNTPFNDDIECDLGIIPGATCEHRIDIADC